MKMLTYNQFVENIEKYVGKTVEIIGQWKETGEEIKAKRYVWDNKSFAKQNDDVLIIAKYVKVLV